MSVIAAKPTDLDPPHTQLHSETPTLFSTFYKCTQLTSVLSAPSIKSYIVMSCRCPPLRARENTQEAFTESQLYLLKRLLVNN